MHRKLALAAVAVLDVAILIELQLQRGVHLSITPVSSLFQVWWVRVTTKCQIPVIINDPHPYIFEPQLGRATATSIANDCSF